MKVIKFNVGDIIQILGDKRRIGLIVKEDKHTPLFLVEFFDPIFREGWYHDDMLIKVQ